MVTASMCIAQMSSIVAARPRAADRPPKQSSSGTGDFPAKQILGIIEFLEAQQK
jgi:hypothetical protein